MKKFIIPVLAAATVMTAASCSKNSSGPATPQAQVMYFNGYLLGAGLNVTANNTAIANGTNLGFLKATGYQNIAAATPETIMFLQNSTNTGVTDSTYTFAANTHYSYFMGGALTSPVQLITTDDVTTPATGMVKVRFVNLSPDTTTDNVYVGSNGTPIATGVKLGQASAFVSVTAGTGLLLQNPNNPTKQINISTQVFATGKIYTIILTGESIGTSTGALTVTVIGNN